MTRGSVAARWAVRAAALSTMSCGPGGPIDHDLGSLVTIVQGIYGQVYSVSDVCPAGTCPETAVSVDLTVTGNALASPATVRSAGRLGFYELALPVGDFEICAPEGLQHCTSFTVSAGARERRDLEYGLLGGFWH